MVTKATVAATNIPISVNVVLAVIHSTCRFAQWRNLATTSQRHRRKRKKQDEEQHKYNEYAMYHMMLK
jgi:uncharacterized protein YacL